MSVARPHLLTALLALAAAASTLPFAGEARAAPPWVDRNLTLPSGDWAFDFGLGVGHVPDDSEAGVNLEMAVGITPRVELGVRTGLRIGDTAERGIVADDYGRLFDRQTFDVGADTVANPEIRVRGALVRDSIAEVALEGRVVLPFADGTGAGLLFGVPLSFHLGDRVRLDTGPYVPVAFPPHADTDVALSIPIDVWIQAGPRFWLGPMAGLKFERLGNNGGATDVSFGFGLGYSIARVVDFKAMFLFPTINNESGDFGVGAGVEVRIE
jgi:hypothetical protein